MCEGKVRLPREVAEAIEKMKLNCEYPVRTAMDIIYRKDFAGEQVAIKEYCQSDRSRRIGYIASALINGYEIEETPEESVRNFYNDLLQNNLLTEAESVKSTINRLGIKIEGVNA